MEVMTMNNMTALVSCFARAYHYRTNQTHIFSDEAAYPILGSDYETVSSHMKQGIPYFLPGFEGSDEDGLQLIADWQLSPSVLGRSAFCEAKLHMSADNGCEQYLILAPGYDTFGIRKKEVIPYVFELDLPEIIEDKKERIQKAGLASVSLYVPCDLSDQRWKNTLLNAGFNSGRMTFASMQGISYYLSNDSFVNLLNTLNSLLTDHSELCFDFPSDDEGREAGVTRDLAQAAGEAMQACYSVSEMTEILDRCGYRIRTMLGPEEMTEIYFSEYNRNVRGRTMEAPKGVRYVHAIGK